MQPLVGHFEYTPLCRTRAARAESLELRAFSRRTISGNCLQIMTYSLKPEVKGGEADTCGPNKLCVMIMGPQYVHEKGTLGDMYIQKYILTIV